MVAWSPANTVGERRVGSTSSESNSMDEDSLIRIITILLLLSLAFQTLLLFFYLFLSCCSSGGAGRFLFFSLEAWLQHFALWDAQLGCHNWRCLEAIMAKMVAAQTAVCAWLNEVGSRPPYSVQRSHRPGCRGK